MSREGRSFRRLSHPRRRRSRRSRGDAPRSGDECRDLGDAPARRRPMLHQHSRAAPFSRRADHRARAVSVGRSRIPRGRSAARHGRRRVVARANQRGVRGVSAALGRVFRDPDGHDASRGSGEGVVFDRRCAAGRRRDETAAARSREHPRAAQRRIGILAPLRAARSAPTKRDILASTSR